MAKLKGGILPLRVETGKFKGLKRELRFCELCNKNKIEDEIHMLTQCEDLKVPRNGFQLYNSRASSPYREVSRWLRPENSNKFDSWLERMMEERRKILYGY